MKQLELPLLTKEEWVAEDLIRRLASQMRVVPTNYFPYSTTTATSNVVMGTNTVYYWVAA